MSQLVQESSPLVFDHYATYYDLLYQDKDYAGEAQFVRQLLAKQADSTTRILELGCGTGGHAQHLLDLGFHIHGIDMSERMVALARQRLTSYSNRAGSPVAFTVADDREVRLGQTFDAVVSLFHVVSYHTTREDVLAMLKTAASHLQSGGVFIFDVWYGPAVLHLKPTITVKRAANEVMRIVRIAEPTLDAAHSTVSVHYEVLIEDRIKQILFRLEEDHRMRYFFATEIEEYAAHVGMVMIDSAEWMTGAPAREDTWGVYFVLQKQ